MVNESRVSYLEKMRQEHAPHFGDVARELGVDPASIRRLSTLSPWRSAVHIAMEWSLIVGATGLGLRFFGPITYPIAVAFIGARQHSLGLLMHEGAHYRLANNRRVNEWLGEALLSWPFMVLSMRAYRRNHFPHHSHLNTEDDPDWTAKQNAEWTFPQRPAQLYRMLLEDLLGIGFIRFAIKVRHLPKPKAHDVEIDTQALKWGRLAFWTAVIVGSMYFGVLHMVLLFWVVPFFTWFQLVLRVRSIAEHFAIAERSDFYGSTRSVDLTWFDRVFVLSNDSSMHVEHHLFPSVPFYRLRELRCLLMQNPDFAQGLHRSAGYRAVIRECLVEARSPEPSAGQA
jgi:fatty acid desaturase